MAIGPVPQDDVMDQLAWLERREVELRERAEVAEIRVRVLEQDVATLQRSNDMMRRDLMRAERQLREAGL